MLSGRSRCFVILVIITTCIIVLAYSRTSDSNNARNNKLRVQTLDVNKTDQLLLSVDLMPGRLGNKLFMYASLLGIARNIGRRPIPGWSQINLTSAFNVTYMAPHDPGFFKGWPVVKEAVWSNWDPVFLTLPKTNVMINGYLQSWKYFHNIRDEIKREFAFQPRVRNRAKEMMEDIRQRFIDKEEVVFVGVHVRSRDKLSSQVITKVPEFYYRKAIQKMKSILPGKHLVFLVACLEKTWCKCYFTDPNVVILQWAPAEVHLAILSSCKHVIIGYSTFGWWGGWLSGGHVIYYKKFPAREHHVSKGFKKEDYFPPDWIGVA